MAAPDPIPIEQLACLWAQLTDPGPDAIRSNDGPLWRLRPGAQSRRLRLHRCAGVLATPV